MSVNAPAAVFLPAQKNIFAPKQSWPESRSSLASLGLAEALSIEDILCMKVGAGRFLGRCVPFLFVGVGVVWCLLVSVDFDFGIKRAN